MNFNELKEFFKKLYPDKLVSFEFDGRCHRVHEIIYTDGIPNPVQHIECNQVKVTPHGMPSQYVPIHPHRMNCTWNEMKKLIMAKE